MLETNDVIKLLIMKKYICGIDENGFGPILGPLVVSGIIAEKGIKIPSFIKDSKLIYRSKKDFLKIEKIAIVLFFIFKRRFPKSPFEIFEEFTSFNCIFKENFCLKNMPLEFKNEISDKIIDEFLELIKIGTELKEIKINVVCPFFLNKFLTQGNSKFILNLKNFCEIIRDFIKFKNVEFFCGKIGSLTFYKNYLYYFFPQFQIKIYKETLNFSGYKLFDENYDFKIFFVKDVEKVSPVACLSSLIGKYIREIMMESIRKSLGIKEEISGYRDKKTLNIIEHFNFSQIRKECIIREA